MPRAPVGASRKRRILARLNTLAAQAAFIKNGYEVGRDDETNEKANALLWAFLARTLGLAK